MNSMQYARDISRAALIVLVIYLITVGLTGCQKQIQFQLERMPSEYRACAAKVVPQINKKGPITQRELIEAYAELKRYANSQNRCLRGAVAWADAQYRAYYQQY
jgi:hypothetical protein